MINSPLSDTELTQLLALNLDGAEQVGGYVKYKSNVMTTYRNGLHDKNMAEAGNDEAWRYYRYELSVFPVAETCPEVQKKIALEILAELNKVGANTEFVAEFRLEG